MVSWLSVVLGKVWQGAGLFGVLIKRPVFDYRAWCSRYLLVFTGIYRYLPEILTFLSLFPKLSETFRNFPLVGAGLRASPSIVVKQKARRGNLRAYVAFMYVICMFYVQPAVFPL